MLEEVASVIELTTKTIKIAENPAPSGSVLVDGSGVGDVGAVVLRDRKILAEDGMVVVILNLQHGQLLSEPEIITRGFIYVKESEELLSELKEVAAHAAPAPGQSLVAYQGEAVVGGGIICRTE